MLGYNQLYSLFLAFTLVSGHEGHGEEGSEDHVHQDSDVVVLTDATFAGFVAKTPLSLIEFYAPWCGHCKKLVPEYEAAATQLVGKVVLAKVDCTVEKKSCEDHGVSGFPTLKIFRNEKNAEYKGQRTTASIVEVMKRQTQPSFTVVKGKDVKTYSESSKLVVMAYIPASSKDHRKILETIATTYRDDFTFGIVDDESFLKEQKITETVIMLHKTFDEKMDLYEGKIVQDDIVSFIQTKSIPVMDDIGAENYDKFIKSGLPMAYFFHSTPEEKSTHGPALEIVAKKYQGKIIFVYIDAVQFGGHADNLGIAKEWPGFGIHLNEKSVKYPFQGKFDVKEIAVFVEKFDKGEIQPFFKSEALPETNDGPVKIVVARNFDEIVKNETADTLVEFYAPWCGHCKKLSPIWDELGKACGSDKIIIAKMDATANDIPGLMVSGFPTIKLYKAKTNEVIEFTGDRTIDGFLSFLKEKAEYGSTLEGVEVAEPAPEEAEDEL